ncbi:MAG: neuraminidase [Treponema sp.]|jgi:hypothetical protein|nr:neuraminidase [Treponema sp.]
MQRKRIPETARPLYGLRGLVLLLALCLLSSGLWARGNRDTATQTAEGSEVWQTTFDVTGNKPGVYNVIVNTQDAAGNPAQSGPFNIRIDPAAGLPTARVVYPEADSVIRQNLNLIGVASGRFGVSRVVIQVDNQDPQTVQGTEYWGRLIDIKNLSEGPHLIRVQAFDSKNLSGPESSVSFIIDRASPVIELSSHKTGDIISGNAAVSGRLDDANGIESAAYSLDGEDFTPLGLKSRKGQTAREFSFSVKTRGLEDGPVVCYIRAADTTGMETVKPYLFFVDNEGPQVEIFSPLAEDDVHGFVQVTGRVYDRVGLSRLYYVWGGGDTDIPLQPGDQYWTADLDFSTAAKSTGSFTVVAVDRSGNTSSASVRLQDRRKIKTPVLVIDYPAKAGLNAMPQDGAIYGHIEPGFDAEAVRIEGLAEEIPARPAFRIPPELIPNGRGVLKLQPRATGAARPGSTVQIRTNKPAPVPGPDGAMPELSLNPSRITVTSPQPFGWVDGASFTLEGSAPGAGRVEFRLGPQEDWRPLSAGAGGAFRATVSVDELAEGPIHLELRSYSGGTADQPLYYPLSRTAGAPEIRIVSPNAERGPVHGNVTVAGIIDSAMPIRAAAYSLDRVNYTPLEFRGRDGRAWFSLSVDFSALAQRGGALSIRVTGASGTVSLQTLQVPFDNSTDLPTLIVNSPNEGAVITGGFEISGVAFDDDAVAAVNWRILRPRSSQGSSGFTRIETTQSFQVAVPFDAVTDGENVIEIYAEDMYGVRSGVTSRTIKVSSASPENRVTSPGIDAYSRRLIVVRGTASDANGIEEVQLSMDNGNTWQSARGAENWTMDLNTSAYRDGVYSLLIRTADSFGVTAITNALINIDNSPPELSLGLPKNDSRTGNELYVAGRVWDNIGLQAATLQLLNTGNSSSRLSVDLPLDEVIMQRLDTSRLPPGEYILRINAEDRAGNSMIASRKVTLARDSSASEVALFNPVPGLDYSGPLFISGRVTGADTPAAVTLFVNGSASSLMEVDRYGYFRYQYPDEMLNRDGPLVFAAGFDAPSGMKIVSKDHPINFVQEGPVLIIDSHRDGEVIAGRPWLSGQAGTAVSPLKEVNMTRKERRDIAVKEVLISFDNGRSFEQASGREKWKFRLETGDFPLGNLPILIRAVFNDGRTAVRRLVLNVDTNAPAVETLDPPEDSIHRDSIVVFGSASDNMTLGAVEVSLRPGDKAGYSVPQFIQGLYLDANFLGATLVDGGIGLSFFKDNVKLQAQVGQAPLLDPFSGERGRFVGLTAGIKLLANIVYLPFDYFLGPDWSFFSMSFALGANFSFFTMEPPRRPSMFMGAILGQWEFARLDFSRLVPNWKYARSFALYLEPVWWIASSDVQAETIFRCAIGARMNIF